MTRLWLVLLCLALLALVLLGMRVGWRNRMRSQVALPPLPDVPHSLGDPLLRNSRRHALAQAHHVRLPRGREGHCRVGGIADVVTDIAKAGR